MVVIVYLFYSLQSELHELVRVFVAKRFETKYFESKPRFYYLILKSNVT